MSETNYHYRSLIIHIKKSHMDYKFWDDLCFKSKNLYNLALYTERQLYFKFHKFISNYELYKLLNGTDAFEELPAQEVSEILKMVYTVCRSFESASREYQKHPSKFTGKPKIPKYKDKITGRYQLNFGLQQLKFKDNYIVLPKKLNNHKIKIPSNINQEDIQCLRIIPQGQKIKLEIVYIKSIEIPDNTDLKYVAGIDLGIDNFAAIAVYNGSMPIILNGKGLKSYNKYFNKKLAYLKSKAMLCNEKYTTAQIQRLCNKRDNYIHTWMHKASKETVKYLVQNKVKAVVIGTNKDWKRNSHLSKKVNQTFIQIPYQKFIDQVTYKAQEQGITVYHMEETYTSGTSFLDNEQPTKDYYNKSRRIKRGLFKSNTGTLINADINAAYQIIKKVFPNANYSIDGYGIVGCNTHPMKLILETL